MYYVVDSEKTFDQACNDLDAAVKRHGFGVLHVHDIGATLRSKGLDFDKQCRVFEVCNPGQAAKVMATDMQLNMALPCRISVYQDEGRIKIGMISPQRILAMLSTDPSLSVIAAEVEEQTTRMIDEAR